DGQGFRLIWFNMNRSSFGQKFAPGRWVRVEGDVDHEQRYPTLSHPKFKLLDGPPAVRQEPRIELEPIYPGMEGVKPTILSRAIRHAAERLLPRVQEGLPRTIREARELCDVRSAFEVIHLLRHFDDPDEFRAALEDARARLVFEEFFTLQVELTRDYVAQRRSASAPRCTERELGRDLVRGLPFALTGAQKEAISQIADDLSRRVPMRRLLQGDVGSGKTVVAFMAAAIAIGSGEQVGLMAPTDILARQHLRRARQFFAALPIDIALLTGGMPATEKNAVLTGLEEGRINLVIGTHAIFQSDVTFRALGLVIIDEQHKFGVEQRETLLAKGEDPHVLAMTATPIPRSLALAVFGDLDLTVIAEKPPGRKPVRTVLRTRARAELVYAYVRERIEENGEQAFFIYPLVEASDLVGNRKNVVEAAQDLKAGPFASLRVGILHGRMDSDAKDAIMQRFARGEVDVLCATTVVEVGVDVPNASLMVIESPEFFGLSQLHQLRGRIGRGERDSMCILLSGFGITRDAEKRLTAFATTDDGFELAETDLRIRGPGQFLGLRQAGLPEFRFGDILQDAHLLEDARVDARRHIGFVPQELNLFGYLTGEEFLRFVASTRGLDEAAQTEQIESLLALTELTHARDRVLKEYSGGMARKISICAALLGPPALLLLDESFVGLDPESTYRIRRRLQQYCDDGGAILLSSHILEMLERVCSRFVIMNEGKIARIVERDELEALVGEGKYRDLTHLYLEATGKEDLVPGGSAA
ncbi:MAG: DEAD/DEAH box helicase, partial [Bradymonadaceae bacterium]